MSQRREGTETSDADTASLRDNVDFLRLLFGRFVTNAGDSLYTIAGTWLVYDLTGSSFYTGLASALLLLPPALQFVSGPLVDRWPLVRTLVWTQLVQAGLILSIPLAAYFDRLSVGLVLVVIPALSLLNQFVYPAQNAALPRIVAESQLTRANSAFSFANQGTNMVFDALGGVLIAAVGTVSLFVLDSVTFVVATLSFVGVRVPERTETSDRATAIDVSGYPSDLRDGVRWLRGTVFAEMMLTTAVTNFGTGVMLAVLPGFAAVRGGSILYGALLGAIGAGGLLGALVASRLAHIGYGTLRIVGLGVGFVLWVAAVYSPWPALSVVLFAITGIPIGVTNVMGQTLIQTVAPEELLGRVTSVDASVSTLTVPVGSFLGGIVGSRVGVVTTMAVAAFGFAFVSLYFAIRPRLRSLPAMDDIDRGEFGTRERPSSASRDPD
ncbi:MFS transporter [Halococcus hamelinensis]|uniref:Transporter, MFS 1 family protein n=1 Tax=Halococcus hamelinensis 100A6 TaxID=1132509 RepID=M0MA17_9EURY|nr:MFS transporter [Halococcus hamelinensis]EMA41250.1 transporter, MFS 1 family protein [Halococcus hamelinensis 100A6]